MGKSRAAYRPPRKCHAKLKPTNNETNVCTTLSHGLKWVKNNCDIAFVRLRLAGRVVLAKTDLYD